MKITKQVLIVYYLKTINFLVFIIFYIFICYHFILYWLIILFNFIKFKFNYYMLDLNIYTFDCCDLVKWYFIIDFRDINQLNSTFQAFLDFRCSVVERRALFKLSQARGRRHIVEVRYRYNKIYLYMPLLTFASSLHSYMSQWQRLYYKVFVVQLLSMQQL